MLVDKNAHQKSTHVWCVFVKFEKPSIIACGKRLSNLQCMNDPFLFLLLVCKFPESSQNFHFHLAQNLIKNFVRKKFVIISTLYIHFVNIVKLSLALIELIKVSHLESNPSMSFINFQRK